MSRAGKQVKRQDQTPMKRRLFVQLAGLGALGALALGALAPSGVFAQRKRITLDEIVIEGNIQKPQAFFILPRANLNFDELKRREDLKKRIIESVKKEPF
jgi:hypothetical protein